MIYPANFEQKTGFDKIKVSIKNKCVTQSAVNKVDDACFLTDKEAIMQLLRLASEMKTICMLENSFPADGYVDACKFLPKIKNIGNYLEINELIDLKTALNTVKQIFMFFSGKRKTDYPSLTELVKLVSLMPEVITEIDRIVDRFGKIKDDASENLYNIRKEIAEKQAAVNRRMQSVVKQAKNEGIADLQSNVSVRNGRFVIPVQAVHKRKIKGLVISESASGKTVFIEPMEVVELNNRIVELEFEEQREIIKILIELTGFFNPYYLDILFSCELLVEIDFIRAKAYYAIETEAGMPIINDEPQIDLRRARHPILMKT
ncbi:MAG: endonuclease MutS2, partial [Prevotellaceae bacterium]|nr:endonuclease MutS2 [Prevotellaceae bacterium]